MKKNPSIPAEYEPISVGKYILYEILFALPVIGIIFAIIYSVKPNQNINLQNFARSFLVFYIIAILVSALIMVFSYVAFIITN